MTVRMKRVLSIGLAAALAFAVLLAGCSKHDMSHEQAAAPEAAAHNHGSAVSKLGLQPAVLDGIQETNDVALIENGKLVEVDLLNTIGTLHGIFAIPKEGTVLITIEGKNVAWSDTPTDYPVKATIPGPVTRRGARVRMSAEQLQQLMAIYYPAGKIEVKENKLHLTTGH